MTNKLISEELLKTYECFERLYNREPNNYNELLEFDDLVSSIIKTFDVPCEQITVEELLKYKKLIDV